jgi:hypothetical protein
MSVSIWAVRVTSHSVTQLWKDTSFVSVFSTSQTFLIVSSLTHVLLEVVVYVPSVSHVPVAVTLRQTPSGRGRTSNAILIGTVSGAAAVVCIIAGAIISVMRAKTKENTSSGDGKRAAPPECHYEDSGEQPNSQMGIDPRYSYSCHQTMTTCDVTDLGEHAEPLFV